MNTFHGSDLEKIEQVYGIRKEEITGFGANVNPLGLSPFLKDYLAGHLDVLCAYPDRNYTALRRAISAYTGAPAEHILVGNGSTELISAGIQAVHPKDAVVLGPAYSEYERELSLVGSRMHYYDLKASEDFHLDVEDLEKFITEDIFSHDTDTIPGKSIPCLPQLLVLCNPNNTTSSAITTEQMKRLLSLCKRNGILVMADETYAEFAPCLSDITAIPLTESYDNLIVLRGVSKFWAAPGLRLGYAVTGNRKLQEQINAAKNPWTVSSLADAAGQVMFTDTEYINRTRSLIREEREYCVSFLSELPGLKVFPAYANFVLVRILKQGITAGDIFEAAIRKKMMIRDCSSFHSLDESFFRFCFMRHEDNVRLMECIKDVISGSFISAPFSQ